MIAVSAVASSGCAVSNSRSVREPLHAVGFSRSCLDLGIEALQVGTHPT
jgi:hypothetical protein